MGESQSVLLAGYQSLDPAEKDFDRLVQLVKDKKVKTEGVILVEKDEEGRVTVDQTGDHLGRKGMGWGGGVGIAVGLAAPPLLAATVVGAAGGALLGKLASHKVESGMESGLGEKLKPGTAAIVAIIDDDSRLAAEQALAQSLAKSVAPISGIRDLKDALAEAAGKFNPDRTVLPIPDRVFAGVAGRTIDQSAADWSFIPGPSAPEDAPNVLIVLIDDAGFGGPDTFGGGIATPNLTRVQQMGLTYNRFHVTAVCSPTRAALLTGRNHHRVGMGGIAELPGPFPGYTGTRPRSCTALPRILRENGYITGGFGKWHMTPGREMGAAGPFDHWPTGWGFDHWWGFLTGAAGQYDPIITQDNSTLGVPEGEDGKLYYFPDDITDKAVEWLHAVRAQDAHKPWFLYYSTGCAHAPHHVRQGVGRQVQGQVRRRLGRVPRADPRAPEEARHRPAGHRADGAPRPVPGVGLAHRRAEAALRPPDGGLRRLLRERRLERRAAPRLDRGDGRPRQHPHHVHLGRQRRQHGGYPHRVLQRDHLLQRRGARRRRSSWRSSRSSAASRTWAASTPLRTSPRRGPTPTTRRSSGASRWPATWAARATRWSWRGRTGSRAAET